jgi:hypothetical protein
VIDVGAIRQEHISNRAPVLVLAKGLKRDFFPKGEVGRGVLGMLAVSVTLFRAVDASLRMPHLIKFDSAPNRFRFT